MSDLRRRASPGPPGQGPAAGGATWPGRTAHGGAFAPRADTITARGPPPMSGAAPPQERPGPPAAPARGSPRLGGGRRQRQRGGAVPHGAERNCQAAAQRFAHHAAEARGNDWRGRALGIAWAERGWKVPRRRATFVGAFMELMGGTPFGMGGVIAGGRDQIGCGRDQIG